MEKPTKKPKRVCSTPIPGTSLDIYYHRKVGRVVVVMQRAKSDLWTVAAMRGGVTYQLASVPSAERVNEAYRLVDLHGVKA